MRNMNITFCIAAVLMMLCFFSSAIAAQEAICARVRIQLSQDVVIARNAFKATLAITNSPENSPLENLTVILDITDEYDQPANNLFGIHSPELSGVSDVDGTGVIQPGTTAIASWLITPTRDAAPDGPVMYFVGGEFSYTQAGSTITMPLFPAPILVRPDPLLVLDYFWVKDVNGDDPFTPEIEPSEPFPLGLRVSNNGKGAAKNFRIVSSQPQIIENEKGLLVDFKIIGSQVNSDPVSPSLSLNLGDIDPGATSIAMWLMTSSLQGRFIEYDATFTHIDGLGNPRLSLIDTVNIHELTHVVRVDEPGDDGKPDFLAKDGDVYRVYESTGIDTAVTDQSGSSTLTFVEDNGTEATFALETTTSSGFIYVKLSDPFNGQKGIREVVRSDGKRIRAENVWLSRTRVENDPWQYFFNLFDADTTGHYTISFGEPPSGPFLPTIQFIADHSTYEGSAVSFLVKASHPNALIPDLGASPLPAGASFIDHGDGTGVFSWIPVIGQADVYPITFTASIGELESSQTPLITVLAWDSDEDGMADAWELEHFQTLDRDGTGDYDGDSVSDLDEFLQGSNPTTSNAPNVPVVLFPLDGQEVAELSPMLTVENSVDPDGDAVNYDFEVYADEGLSSLVAGVTGVAENLDVTSWTVSLELSDNTWYFWRTRASDGTAVSEWAYARFFVNIANDPPGEFQVSGPEDGAEVDVLSPELRVTNSSDVDQDSIVYIFEVYSDPELTSLATSSPNVQEDPSGSTGWTVSPELEDNTWYYWAAIAADGHGAQTTSEAASFFVNTANDAPSAPTILSPADGSEVLAQDLNLMVGYSEDVDWDLLTYWFEIDKTPTFDGLDKQTSGWVDEMPDTTSWLVSGLDDNTAYFWRAKASDGLADSPWAQAGFFLNTENDPPSVPTIKNPGENAWVETLTPLLQVNPSSDIDNDTLVYEFEVYTTPAPSPETLTTSGSSDTTDWTVTEILSDNAWLHWRAEAIDEHGRPSGWSAMSPFFVNNDGIDDPPTITLLEPASDIELIDDSVALTWQDTDPDSNAVIALYYDTDNTGEDGILIVDELEEDSDGLTDSYEWDLTGLSIGTYWIYAVISDGASVSSSYAPGSVTIISQAGDLNNDDCIDRDDHRILMRGIRSGELNDLAYDLNGDDQVNRADARTLVRLFTRPRGLLCK